MSEVDEKIELHLIDTATLVEEAKKLREAENLVKQSKKIKRELAAGISPLGNMVTPSNVPKGFFEGGPQTRLGAIHGARTDNEFKKMQKKQQDLERELDNIRKKTIQFEEKIIGNLSLAQTILTNPASVPNILISKLGKFGIIGTVIAGAVGTIYEELSRQFERGGVWSTKIKVPQQALTLNDLEEQNAYRSGTKYITSDLTVHQRGPASSNTASIKSEHIRYTMENMGR